MMPFLCREAISDQVTLIDVELVLNTVIFAGGSLGAEKLQSLFS